MAYVLMPDPSAFAVVGDAALAARPGFLVQEGVGGLPALPVVWAKVEALGMEHGVPGDGPADTFPEAFWPELRLYVPPGPVVPEPPAGTGQTRILAGPGFNLLSRATTSVWVADQAPARSGERLFDGRTDLAFRLLGGSDKEIDVDPGAAMAVDFLSIHGHNLDGSTVTVELHSSRDNFGVDDVSEAVGTISQPSFAVVLPVPVTRRFWRVRFPGENPVPIAIGEVVLGLSRRLIRAPEYPLGVEAREPTERDETAAGEVYVRLLASGPRRSVSLEYWLASEDAYQESRDELFGKGGNGDPIVILPNDLDPSLVIHGRIAPVWETPLKVKDRWLARYVVTEDAFPGEEE